MNDTRAGKKEKCQYIQVFVRVRPTSSAEKNSKSTTIVEIPNESEVIVHERPHEKFSKKYKFDNVFGPSSKQIDVYNVVVSPLLEQVLAGFNCTVFAYGQTGTGKTFTMEGINNDPTLHWQSDSSAGIIPRSLSHLFDKLQLMEAQEYTIRASFLELYNEDLFDLLSPNDDGSKIRLYEDSSKKGAVIIHGLEEVTVHNKCDVYTILQKGSERRQTAATLMNSQSSRSHTVFSITVHMKENAIEGEEVLKTGKLNLVDLAGSENVGKSGAVDRRAREAGSINQSLLTLGRVITALVERAPHIPYRESKLTRLLQESLGGRTKTSIIATISPAGINLEETLSTLDYALRAKSITNRPEINQKVSKKEFLRQYTEEIERLRKDLLATRERNGVYLANENYNEMQAQISQQNKELEEKINHIKALEKMLQDKEKIFNDLELQNHAQMKELHEAKIKLTSATDALISTKSRLKQTAQEKEEQKYLVEKHMHTEQTLLSEAQTLLTVADTATADSHKLHDKIARKNETEQTFGTLCEEFKTKYREGLQGIKQDVTTYAEKLVQFGLCMKRNLDAQSSIECSSIDTPTHEDTSVSQCVSETENVTQTINRLYTSYEKWTENETNNTVSTVNAGNELLDSSYRKMVQNINGIIDREILKHLQIMKSKVSQKLNEANSIIKDMLDSACTSEMEIYNQMRKDVEQITKDIEVLSKKQKFTEKQRLLTKKMEALYSQFNILNQCQEHYYSDVIKKCNHITKVCNEVNEQTSNNYNINVTTNNNLKGLIESNVREIEKHVTEETQLCEDLAEKSVKQGKVIINELTSKISENCNKMERYKNLIKCNAKDMQSQINADRMETLSLVNEANKAILDISKNYTQFMQDKKLKCVKDSDEMSKKLNDEVEKLYTWSKEVTKKLQKVENEIEKFFNTDIERDVPTGATPVRREFSYPRQFKPTSPHERILQRFRESRKFVETLEDDDDVCLSSDITMKQIANSTAIADVIDMPDSLDNTVLAVSAVNNDLQKNTVLRQSIESELERITQTFNDSSICMHPRSQSEPTIYITNGNKENHNCGISTHDKVKITQKSRLKKPKAKILGIHN